MKKNRIIARSLALKHISYQLAPGSQPGLVAKVVPWFVLNLFIEFLAKMNTFLDYIRHSHHVEWLCSMHFYEAKNKKNENFQMIILIRSCFISLSSLDVHIPTTIQQVLIFSLTQYIELCVLIVLLFFVEVARFLFPFIFPILYSIVFYWHIERFLTQVFLFCLGL